MFNRGWLEFIGLPWLSAILGQKLAHFRIARHITQSESCLADKLHIVIFWPVFPIHYNVRDYRLGKCFKGFMMRTANKNKSKFGTGRLSFLSFQNKPREKNLLNAHKCHMRSSIDPKDSFLRFYSLSLASCLPGTKSFLISRSFQTRGPLLPSFPAAAARRLSCLLNHFLITFRWDLTESARSD